MVPSPTSPARLWLAGLALALGALNAGAQTTRSADSPSTPPVRLNPVLRAQEPPVRLDPILRPALPIFQPQATPSPASQWMDAGLEALDRGETQAAREEFDRIIREHPGSPEAPEALLQASRLTPRLDASLALLERLVADYPDAAQVGPALERIGELSFLLGDFDRAAGAYDAFRSRPDVPPEAVRAAEIKLALAMLRAGRHEAAGREFASLRRRYPDLEDAPDLLEGEADARLALAEFGRADALLERIEFRFPNYGAMGKVLMGRGLCAELSADPAAARAFYERIQRDWPRGIEARLARERVLDLDLPLIPPPDDPPAAGPPR